ncbi:LysE/ArgO family amino acid transporter [Tropicimonas sp. S265A]|uniref:LysE/ArgO family amino acid transporter n=1 Tax=Tropicimonas sp. S265A TaxID=3415134 RepID=UPI003C7B8BB2
MDSMTGLWTAAIAGFAVSLQLILAIGAQNAFVLRQGLRRAHVGAVVATCIVSEILLIGIGVTSFATVEARFPAVGPILLYGGAAVLIWYGISHARAAWRGGDALTPEAGGPGSLRAAVLTCLAITWANPHVYLDTVILLGALSRGFPGAEVAFGMGAATASALFFVLLGYGARLLAPIFARPAAWRVLDAVIAVTMWAIAAKLLYFGVP